MTKLDDDDLGYGHESLDSAEVSEDLGYYVKILTQKTLVSNFKELYCVVFVYHKQRCTRRRDRDHLCDLSGH